jgi:AbrB family looped-hinge helix DNA binding protein
MVTKRTTTTRAQRPIGTRTTAGKRSAKARTASRKRVAETKDEPRFVGKHIFAKGKVSSKGWVVIPKEIRDEMGIKPGDEVSFGLFPPPLVMKQDRGLYSLHIHRVPEDIVGLTYGMLKRRPGEPLMTERLLEERRRENEAEERTMRPPKRRVRA